MSQKKTVFERLEDKMIELQQNIENSLTKLQTTIENLKEEIPRSIGQNLMSFTDMIGAKFEDLEEAIKKINIPEGQTGEPSALNALQGDLNSIKSSLSNLQTAIKGIKTEIPPSKTPTPAASLPPKTPMPAVSPKSTPKPTPKSTPKPTPKSTTSTTAKPVSTPPPSSSQGPVSDVFKLLDSIKEKAESNITATQLASEMEQVRDTIVKIFRWHPALYELATFARRLKKFPEGAALDNETKALLLEKIEEWKNRVSSS